jgi:hypothetical protein
LKGRQRLGGRGLTVESKWDKVSELLNLATEQMSKAMQSLDEASKEAGFASCALSRAYKQCKDINDSIKKESFN